MGAGAETVTAGKEALSVSRSLSHSRAAAKLRSLTPYCGAVPGPGVCPWVQCLEAQSVSSALGKESWITRQPKEDTEAS